MRNFRRFVAYLKGYGFQVALAAVLVLLTTAQTLPYPYIFKLVIDRAIASDQGLKYVYVLDAENKLQYRRITTGPLQDDGLRVVEGLKADDWVVIGALQQVRPRMQIRPDKVAMPSFAPQAGADQKSEAGGQKSGK